ncbi:glycosyltransferase family 2 protein [bacterium]|jgi:glycosyltransferase involved in cell wall biosynthesis|nr:glycosyltransferase family 2 protein [bacterium]MDA9359950.1 glycosyltransferase family 2 protein [bacterium]MDB9845585.1 glycosyltransferase family 2 protein [Acidimicrobiales bacterium]
MWGYDMPAVKHELLHRFRRRKRRNSPPLAAAAQPQVSVVCVSNRPAQLEHIIHMFNIQDWPNKNLVLVVNAECYPTEPVDALDAVTVIRTAQEESLGSCLNRGFAAATGEVIVRFDDDDWYAPNYVASAVETFKTVDAQVIGKCEYFAYIESRDHVVRRFSGRAERHVGRVAGGSLVVLAEAVARVRFPDCSIGEDVEYVRRCEREGLRVWATAPQGFLQMRSVGGGHTWGIGDAEFAAGSTVVDKGRAGELWQ